MQRLEADPLSSLDTRELAYSIIFSASRDELLQYPESDPPLETTDSGDPELAMARLQERSELDVVFTIPKLARVRANLFLQRGTVGAALRIMPLHPYTIEELRLPPVLKEMAQQPQGLIVITGPTGSGKTTTMAALIEEINRT